jgi:hypothetical protein
MNITPSTYIYIYIDYVLLINVKLCSEKLVVLTKMIIWD